MRKLLPIVVAASMAVIPTAYAQQAPLDRSLLPDFAAGDAATTYTLIGLVALGAVGGGIAILVTNNSRGSTPAAFQPSPAVSVQ